MKTLVECIDKALYHALDHLNNAPVRNSKGNLRGMSNAQNEEFWVSITLVKKSPKNGAKHRSK